MARRGWPGRASVPDAIDPPGVDSATGIHARLASAVRFVRSHFTCYFVAHPDYASAVDQAKQALGPQVGALRAELATDAEAPCAGDAAILGCLHGFATHYASRNHIRSPEAQLEVTAEVLLALFGEAAGSRMSEALEALVREPSAPGWIRRGRAMADSLEASGAAPVRELIDQRLESLRQMG